jgi:hypothetical protein
MHFDNGIQDSVGLYVCTFLKELLRNFFLMDMCAVVLVAHTLLFKKDVPLDYQGLV